MNLNSILIGSENPERLVEYYTKLFGKPTWDEGGYVGWLIGSGAVTVGPHDEVKGKNAHPGRIIWNIESPDVRGDFDRFKAAGATVVAEPYGYGMPDVDRRRGHRDVRGPRRQLFPADEPDAGGSPRLTGWRARPWRRARLVVRLRDPVGRPLKPPAADRAGVSRPARARRSRTRG